MILSYLLLVGDFAEFFFFQFLSDRPGLVSSL